MYLQHMYSILASFQRAESNIANIIVVAQTQLLLHCQFTKNRITIVLLIVSYNVISTF